MKTNNKIIEKIKEVFDKKFGIFLIIGVINTIVGFGIQFLLYNLINWEPVNQAAISSLPDSVYMIAKDTGYWVSTALNYILASILSYHLNKRFTFKYKGDTGKSALRFALSISVCYLIANGIAKPLISYVMSGFGEQMQGNMAMLLGGGLFVILNYFGQRFFAFRETETAGNDGTPDNKEDA